MDPRLCSGFDESLKVIDVRSSAEHSRNLGVVGYDDMVAHEGSLFWSVIGADIPYTVFRSAEMAEMAW